MLGRGVYDLNEAARLTRPPPGTLARWCSGTRPLLTLAYAQLFDFEDLVGLLVIAELRHRKVPRSEIWTGIRKLMEVLGVDRPLAHVDAPSQLATSGKAFLAHIGEWVDAGKGLQGAFQVMIEPVLEPLEYGPTGTANRGRALVA